MTRSERSRIALDVTFGTLGMAIFLILADRFIPGVGFPPRTIVVFALCVGPFRAWREYRRRAQRAAQPPPPPPS